MSVQLTERICIIEDRVFTARRIAVYAAAIMSLYLLVLGLGIAEGLWIETRAGVPAANDFLPMWVAGRQAIEHGAASAYDWPTMLAAERAATQGAFIRFYPWPYPPPFFFPAMAVAVLPYAAAFAVWMGSIALAYAAAIYAIVPRWVAPLVALASPPAAWGLAIGQNGMLAAALLGGSLAFIPTRPVLAGVLLGLLTYKPHFGLLFPLVLAVTGTWRVVASAGATALALAAASYLAFGAEAWMRFAATLVQWGDSALNTQTIGWSHLQSLYGVLRWLGAGGLAAWSVHIAFALAVAAAVSFAWLQPIPYALKAALLSVGALLVTPYIFVYDLAILGVPIAFIVKDALSSGFYRGERLTLVVFVIATLLALPMGQPKGLVEILAAAGLVALRIMLRARSKPASPLREDRPVPA